MKLAAFVLCILSIVELVVAILVVFACGTILEVVIYETTGYTFGALWILGIIFLIPLAYSIPMTIHIYNGYKGKKELSIAFKICVVLFLNFIGGILLLLDDETKKHSNNVNNNQARDFTNSQSTNNSNTNNSTFNNSDVILDVSPSDKEDSNNP